MFWALQQFHHDAVLIVPLWNWNTDLSDISKNEYSFNRTFMELKYCLAMRVLRQCKVLIVPLWNWNAERKSLALAEEVVLIVPLWNWNGWAVNIWRWDKSVLIVPLWNWNNLWDIWERRATFVLIVPLWNWNNFQADMHIWLQCFNRTFMELKSREGTCGISSEWVLIVPLWNWNTMISCW